MAHIKYICDCLSLYHFFFTLVQVCCCCCSSSKSPGEIVSLSDIGDDTISCICVYSNSGTHITFIMSSHHSFSCRNGNPFKNLYNFSRSLNLCRFLLSFSLFSFLEKLYPIFIHIPSPPHFPLTVNIEEEK